MDQFDKLKIASSSLGERLKTGGVQMSRIVSSKMKEILQAPTPESKMIDEATLETLEEPNWGLNLRICGMINNEQFNGTEVVKAIKKKFMGKSPVGQRLSLDLLEACTSNCDKVFSEVASEKVLDEMVKMIDDPKTDPDNRIKAMQLIRAWGDSEELMYLPVFHQTYANLKTRPVHQGMQEGSNLPAMQHSLESYMDEGTLSPPESYPIPETGFPHREFAYINHQSTEEKRQYLVETRNSLEVLSSLLNGESESIKSELTISLFEKCKGSLSVVQTIIETTSDDEGMLFESLSLHDELQQVISQCLEAEAKIDSGGSDLSKETSGTTLPSVPEGGDCLPPPPQVVHSQFVAAEITAQPHGSDSKESLPQVHSQSVAEIVAQPHVYDSRDSWIESRPSSETPKAGAGAGAGAAALEKESVVGVKDA